MFDISWTEIMVIGVVALLVVGPKELPALLRTVGHYLGVIKRQAAEFRAQFDEAMRESELERLKQEVESAGREMAATVHDASRSVETEIDDARREFDQAALTAAPEPDARDARDANVPLPAIATAGAGNGAANPSVTAAGAAAAPLSGEVEAKTGA
jgi:sec-independent protein translocase protein TatB